MVKKLQAMKHMYFILPAAVMLLAAAAVSCSLQEDEWSEAPVSVEKTILRLSLAPTRTSLGASEDGARKVYWSDGDRVVLNGTVSDALENIGEEATSAEFSFDGALTAPYNILYPAEIYTTPGSITLPAVQTWKSGTFDDGMFPMAAYSADGSSPLPEYLCAVVKISVRLAASDPDTDNIRLVTFSGGAGEQVSGVFNLDYQTAALTATSTGAADKKVQVSLNQALSASTPLDVFLVVPARTYASGFSITVQDSQGHTMTRTLGASTTLSAGKLYNMPAFPFIPSGSATGIEIYSAEDLISFATRYNSGELSNDVPGGLIATVMQDIVFDDGTSGDFNGTGGIGSASLNGETNYFNGIFNGNGKTISGLKATVPLFAYTGGGGTVKGLTLDSSCSFVFTHSNTAEGEFGAVAGYHKGNLQNVTVNADVSLAAVSNVAHLTSFGGIVGRATTGTLNNCTYGGLISTPSGFTGTKKLIIGGLVGRISNAGSVSGSVFSGAISNEAQITSTDKSNPYLIIGGIVGHLEGGATVSSCATTLDHATISGDYSNTAGIIVNKTTTSYNSADGGIVGELVSGEVNSCTNAASILNVIIRQTDVDAQARYIQAGGLVGKIGPSGSVTGSTNNGSVMSNSNPRLQYTGGIAGTNAGTVSSCTNNAAILTGTCGVDPIYGSRILYIGGIIGNNTSSSVSDVHNTADLTLSRFEMGTAVTVHMGGVIGYNEGELNGGAGKSITNTGKVYFNTNSNKNTCVFSLGGIVGYSKASLQNLYNSGYVHFNWNNNSRLVKNARIGGIVGWMDGDGIISDCDNEGGDDNSGEVFLAIPSSTSVSSTENYMGGILGYTVKNVSISNCFNSGYVHGGNSGKVGEGTNGETCFAGGIVGYLAGVSSISECTNSAIVFNDQFNNEQTAPETKSVYTGGIAGYVKGTNDNPISLSDCEHNTSNLGPRRGLCGGIAGYVEYASLINCNTIGVNFAGSAWFVGGIIGFGVNTMLTNCTWSGTTINTSQIRANGGGGIASKITGCTIDGCYSYATTIQKGGAGTYGGALVGVSVSGNTIQNCHYKNVLPSAVANGTFTDGGGNAADL